MEAKHSTTKQEMIGVTPIYSIEELNARLQELMKQEGLEQGVIATCALLSMVNKVGHQVIGIIGYKYSDSKHSVRHMWLINPDGTDVFNTSDVCKHTQGKSRNRRNMDYDKLFNSMIRGCTENVRGYCVMSNTAKMLNTIVQSQYRWASVIAQLNKEGLIFDSSKKSVNPSFNMKVGTLKMLMGGAGLVNACLTSSCIILSMAHKAQIANKFRGAVGYYVLGLTDSKYLEGTVLPSTYVPTRDIIAITHVWVEETTPGGLIIHDLSQVSSGHYSYVLGDADHLDLNADNAKQYKRFRTHLDKCSTDGVITDWISPLQTAVDDKEQWKWVLSDLTRIGMFDAKVLDQLGANVNMTMLQHTI